MRHLKRSFGYAVNGFVHAVRCERSLRLFLPVYVLVLLLGAWVSLLSWEWLAIIIAGSFFLAIELLNTAIERLADVLDEERKLLGRKGIHAKMKATKDVAASASLISFTALIVTILIVFRPYIEIYVLH